MDEEFMDEQMIKATFTENRIVEEKKRRYCALVNAVNRFGQSESDGTFDGNGVSEVDGVSESNGASKGDGADIAGLTTFPECKEVNLWACWEGGINHLNADILLVGQDWGCLSYDKEPIAEAVKNGRYRPGEFCYMQGNENPTNLALCELFREINQDYDLFNDRNTCTELFFTNFIPWYRTGTKISGPVRASWIRKSQVYFAELVDILAPKVILCLGRTVFDGVTRTGGISVQAGWPYNAVIEAGPIPLQIQSAKTLAVPLAHCGVMGTLNRNGRQKTEQNKRLELQKKDWARIRGIIETEALTIRH